MISWEIIPNPPFSLEMASDSAQSATEWHLLKQQLLSGITLTGKIFARTHFGVFFDAGIGLPVRMNVPDFGPPDGGMVFPTDYPALGSSISGQLAGFDESWRQVVAWKGFTGQNINTPWSLQKQNDGRLLDHPLISINSEIRFGRACLAGTRISVADVLAWLGNGMSFAEIISDFPELNEELIRACCRYAANR
jgi:uncharacterized protein (DUF433 family)